MIFLERMQSPLDAAINSLNLRDTHDRMIIYRIMLNLHLEYTNKPLIRINRHFKVEILQTNI